MRGGEEYTPPCGWYRYGLRVKFRFDNGDNSWLGPRTHRNWTSAGEWAVSYHDTGLYEGRSIAQDGYEVTGENASNFGRWMFSTPDPETAARYSKQFEFEEDHYQVMLQNRVNPKTLVKIPADSAGGVEFWVSPEADIRPYGVLVRKVSP